MMFQDRGAVGRIPYLMPVRWEDDWPVLGGETEKYLWSGRCLPEKMRGKRDGGSVEELVISDSFDHSENRLALQWQWNHSADPEAWSFYRAARPVCG